MKTDVIEDQNETVPAPRSLRELIDRVTGKGFIPPQIAEDAGLAEVLPFPFLALIGQQEMKLALILGLINPVISGILLVGPRGTGKSTAVRSLVNLLPSTLRSLCHYGCMPEDIEAGGIDAVCPDCIQKFARGEPLAKLDLVRLVELPLNATIDDVVGGVDERAALQGRNRIRRGLLAQADRNILYVDEVNLLQDDVVDVLLDAAAQGTYTVRRGPLSATFWSRFVLIGSMNPEEGSLRPQIQDRFGLRVIVNGLTDPTERMEVYQRVQAYKTNPRQVVSAYAAETSLVQTEIQTARDHLMHVSIPQVVAESGLELIVRMKIASLRAEITLFEAARALAAADGREMVTYADLRAVAPMALRLRRSVFIQEYFSQQQLEDQELSGMINEVIPS